MKRLSALLVVVFLLVGCSPKITSSEYEHQFIDSNGVEQKVLVDITLNNGKISEISIDETYLTKDSKVTTKKTLKDDYGMSKTTDVGEWYEQIAHLEKELIGTNGKLSLDDKGYPTDTDITSGCTIKLTEIQKAINEAIQNAK